jgi:hypothetical protein
MTRYESLKRSAKEAAKFRGHRLGRFQFSLQSNRMVGSAICKDCNATITINTNPLPNEIDIAGTAVAMGCVERRNKLTPTCSVCGSVLSAVTFTCVRGKYCKPQVSADQTSQSA